MINAILRGFNVKRYHTQPRIIEETVGLHTAGVLGIILHLDPGASRDLLVAAVFHDLGEGFVGDTPAPFKRRNPEVRTLLHRAEEDYAIACGFPQPELTPEEFKLLKLADIMQLILSSVQEMGMGNQYARECIREGQRYIDDMDVGIELLQKCDRMVQEVKGQYGPMEDM
jgi:5'-deoxynucleotidase YfbR-like HD superfamily hydrolase